MTIDRIPTKEISESAEALFAISGLENASYLMALIDHAFLPKKDLFKHWPGGRPSVFNLIAHLSGGEERIAPLLIPMPSEPDDRLRVVAYLLKQCNTHPMLSILTSKVAPENIAQHLSTLTQVILPPDSMRYLLRFADTRIVPELDRLLDTEQRAQLFGLFDDWVYLTRAAQWSVIKGEGTKASPASGPLKLSDAQLDAFLRASLPDNLIPVLHHDSARFSEMKPSTQYQLVCHWISGAISDSGGQADPGTCLAHCQSNLSYL